MSGRLDRVGTAATQQHRAFPSRQKQGVALPLSAHVCCRIIVHGELDHYEVHVLHVRTWEGAAAVGQRRAMRAHDGKAPVHHRTDVGVGIDSAAAQPASPPAA